MTLLNKRSNAQEGIALIELAIYIAILALLAVGAYLGYQTLFGEAQETQTMTKLQKIRDGAERFYMKTNRYPTKLKDLLVRPQDEGIAKKWRGPYIDNQDLEDGWGNKMVYKPPQAGQKKYELYSHGPNGPGSPKVERVSL